MSSLLLWRMECCDHKEGILCKECDLGIYVATIVKNDNNYNDSTTAIRITIINIKLIKNVMIVPIIILIKVVMMVIITIIILIKIIIILTKIMIITTVLPKIIMIIILIVLVVIVTITRPPLKTNWVI